MGQIQEIKPKEIFDFLNTLVLVPTILVKQDEILFSNHAFLELMGISDAIGSELEKDILQKMEEAGIFQKNHNDSNQQTDGKGKELRFIKNDGSIIFVQHHEKEVQYKGELCILVELQDITEKKIMERGWKHLSYVHEKMLRISQSILQADSIEQACDEILEKALECVEHAQLGSIFRIEKDMFRILAYRGYAKEIEKFVLPLNKAIIYSLSKGRMDETYYIRDVSNMEEFYPVHTEMGERTISSTVTSPIYVNGELFGIINIDSLETNAFTPDDLLTMQFVRNSVEIAISNRFLYEKNCYLAKYDALTSMYNRAQFNEAFGTIVNSNQETSFLFAIIDMNGLKHINDEYGHLFGDAAIRTMANAIKNITQKPDIAARIGGDEFYGMYFDTSEEALKERFERTIQFLKDNPCDDGNNRTELSFSYGIARYPQEGKNFTELTMAADERMYEYKKKYKEEHPYKGR